MSRVPRTFALRDYGTARWTGGDEGCDHLGPPKRTQAGFNERYFDRPSDKDKQSELRTPYRDVCGKCGARRVDAQIGLEPTPGDFVAEMVRVFREVRRVLRPDGTCWLNMGDGFASHAMEGDTGSKENGRRADRMVSGLDKRRLGIRPKNLLGMPWRVAFALQEDGWILRSEIIWSKPNPMPESVADRPAKSHEYLFLLAKSPRYYFDQEAVREKAEYGRRVWKDDHYKNGDIRIHHKGTTTGGDPEAGRNLRSVWTIPTESYIGAHFATFPRRLVEPCIRAGTSGRGVCPACGAPWVREVERKTLGIGYTDHKGDLTEGMSQYAPHSRKMNGETLARFRAENPIRTLGWRPSCPCDAGEPVPATVFDPFIGSGTTIVVAEALGRRGVGLDLSRDYLGLARRRIERPHARIPRPQSAGPSLPLFDR